MDIKNLIKFSSTNSDKIITRESSLIEFKETFNWISKSVYAKSMAAFSNTKGGYLIFGVTNSPRQLKVASSFADLSYR